MDTATTTGRTGALAGLRVGVLISAAVAAVLLLVSLLGPGWVYVPANPAVPSPAMTLDFNDLGDLSHSGTAPTTSVQQAYFGWLGWALVIIAVVVLFAAAILGHRILAVSAAVMGVVGLVFTLFGVKGAQAWSALIDQLANIRIGGYLVLCGYVLALVTGMVIARRQLPPPAAR